MKTIDLTDKRIIISRTDSIGDVMLTLPLCAWIKEKFPSCTIIFLGKGYTKSVVKAFDLVDEFVDWKDIWDQPKVQRIQLFREIHVDAIIHVFPDREIASLAKKIRIPARVGTSHRSYHLLTCTHRPSFTRKRSELHEAQLNHELLRPFGLTEIPTLEAISASTKHFHAPEVELPSYIDDVLKSGLKTVVLHPKSQGSAREWPMEKYVQLTEELVKRNYSVLFTGTENEGEAFRDQIPTHPHVIDTTGKLSLDQLIYLISRVDALVACSTGPLHIAGFLGVNTIGFYVPKRPIHPGRWKALGPNVSILVNDEKCVSCGKKANCNCIAEISVERVLEIV